jgi:RNA polymerase sigma factor (sigma-70 family)
MAAASLHHVLTYLRRVMHGGAGDRTDGDLLRRFVAGRDEGAFETLLKRYGPMVLAVCRRILDNETDAEDAFQAVFLVLVRQACAVHRHESIGSFLHGVALRTALRFRSDLARRRHHERHGAAMPAAEPTPDTVWRDLRPVLDEEVARLPGKYREPLRLCYLEGKTYDEAAHALGCSRGTISSRLTRARERLRRRLMGRGVTLSGSLLATVLVARAAPAAVPPPLLQVALRAAAEVVAGSANTMLVSSQVLQLSEEIVQSMSMSKLRIVAGLLLAVCALGVAGFALSRSLGGSGGAFPGDEAAARAEGFPAWQECARLGSAVGSAQHVMFSPDSRTLATVDGDGVLRVWDTATWEQRVRYDVRKRYGDRYNVQYTPFSPDSRLLNLLGQVPDPDRPGQWLPEVMVLEVATGKEIARLPGHDGRFCPDGTSVFTWLRDTATLWDVPACRKRFDLKAAAPLAGSGIPTFSDDGALLFAPTASGRAHLWNTVTGKEQATVEGYTAAFAPDGKVLATQLPGGVIKLWNTATGRERGVIRSNGNTGLWPVFSADGRRLLTYASFMLKRNGQADLSPGVAISQLRIRPVDIRLWDVATGKELAQLPGMSKYNVHAAFSPDGKTVVYSRLEADATDREELVLWDVEAGKDRIVLRTTEGLGTATFSRDGKVLFTAATTGANLKAWDPATGWRFPDVRSMMDAACLARSPDSRLLAALPGRVDPSAQRSMDLVVYRLSDRPLPAPVVRGQPARDAPVIAQPQIDEPRRTPAARALANLRKESGAAVQEVIANLQGAKTDVERTPLQNQLVAGQARCAARALAIARDHSADPAAVEALEFCLHSTSGGFGGATGKVRDAALELIRREFLRSPDLSRLLYCLAHQHTDPACELLIEIAETSPHRVIRGRAAYVLAEALAEKADVARLIRLPELANRPELKEKAAMLEPLRKADPDALDRRAEACYVRVQEKYADVARSDHEPGTLGDAAERGLFALRHLGVGRTAPDIDGEDLDGKRFKLSDYRGQVVVLVFCGHWCGPCREMNPQKRRLAERLADRPFALVEVNSDEDREVVKRTMRKEKLPWRCWFDDGREGPIARRWNVHRWPSVYVLDAAGVIRYKDLHGEALDKAVMRLLQEGGKREIP